jgi:histidinol dehydrogenase
MRVLSTKASRFDASFNAFCRRAETSPALRRAVEKILAEVKNQGDRAVSNLVERFDGAQMKPREFRLDPAELKAGYRRLARADRRAMRDALKNIELFNRATLPRDWSARNNHGARTGERFYPLNRVGVYIPRGLVSSVLMTCGLARLARVPEIAVFTPCDAQGVVADGVLGALYLVGISEAYRIGGVPAIGVMAYGTRSIRPVVKVYGPGNAYVVEAKRQVFGSIGVDLLPGPSEVMVIADETSDPATVAADLLAQAEHGSGQERVFLASPSRKLIDRAHAEIGMQIRSLPRFKAINRVLKNGFLSVETRDLDEAAALAERVAPEHLEIALPSRKARRLLKRITTAGAVMIGHWSATALGDFVAGPSHELPTGGAGHYASGLQVSDFMRRSSIIEYSKASLQRGAASVASFSALEELEGHGRSAEARFTR